MPDADDFRALARSSPWLFTTLRFTFRHGPSGDPVRAWLRRPDLLRVEAAAGGLLGVVRGRSHTSTVLGAGPWDPLPEAPPPVLRSDGLVAVRPWDLDRADDPMWQDYRWVAMLDPVELADGQDRDTGEPLREPAPPVTVEALREVEHGGRPAWEAVVATTSTYDPCCSCCPLLRDAEIDRLEWGAPFEGVEYPSATVVRLDVGTGVCVWTETLDGSYAGDGHEVLIEAVDEPMDDDLFVEPPPPPGPPGYGYRPFPSQGGWDAPGGGLEEWLAKRSGRKAERARRPPQPGRQRPGIQ